MYSYVIYYIVQLCLYFEIFVFLVHERKIFLY